MTRTAVRRRKMAVVCSSSEISRLPAGIISSGRLGVLLMLRLRLVDCVTTLSCSVLVLVIARHRRLVCELFVFVILTCSVVKLNICVISGWPMLMARSCDNRTWCLRRNIILDRMCRLLLLLN